MWVEHFREGGGRERCRELERRECGGEGRLEIDIG